MFNWTLFLILVAVSVPGILVILLRRIESIRGTIENNLKPGQLMPSIPILFFVSALQSLFMVAIMAAIGTAVAPRVGLQAPFFAALAGPGNAWAALQPQLGPAILWSVLGVVPFLLAYYGIVRPNLEPVTVEMMEISRLNLGLSSRLLYGGIYEEVLTRWGLMSLFVWLITLVVGEPTVVVVWLAIILSGILFGLGHLPSFFAAGGQKSTGVVPTAIFLNLWASLFFGWLFWQVGLAAAMIGHMLFHLLWWPFDLALNRRRPLETQAVTV